MIYTVYPSNYAPTGDFLTSFSVRIAITRSIFALATGRIFSVFTFQQGRPDRNCQLQLSVILGILSIYLSIYQSICLKIYIYIYSHNYVYIYIYHMQTERERTCALSKTIHKFMLWLVLSSYSHHSQSSSSSSHTISKNMAGVILRFPSYPVVTNNSPVIELVFH